MGRPHRAPSCSRSVLFCQVQTIREQARSQRGLHATSVVRRPLYLTRDLLYSLSVIYIVATVKRRMYPSVKEFTYSGFLPHSVLHRCRSQCWHPLPGRQAESSERARAKFTIQNVGERVLATCIGLTSQTERAEKHRLPRHNVALSHSITTFPLILF